MSGTWRSGGRPVPTALRVVDGKKVRARDRRSHEPGSEIGMPPMPEHVSQDPLAKEYWEREGPKLIALRLLQVGHGEMFAGLCHALANRQRALTVLADMQHRRAVLDETTTAHGSVRRRVRENPVVKQAERAQALAAKLLAEFGLSPVAAAKLSAPPLPQPDAFEEFLRRPRRRG